MKDFVPAWLQAPSLADRQSERYATPKYQITPRPLVKDAKRKSKEARAKEFRAGVWARDDSKSRASGKPLARSGSDFHKVGEVHHVLPRSLAPELIYEVSNGLLLSKHEHMLAEAICPYAPQHRLLDIIGPDDRSQPQVFIWRNQEGKEVKRRVS